MADEVTGTPLAAVKTFLGCDTLKRSLTLQDEFTVFDGYRYLLFLDPRKVGFKNESSVGLVKIKLGTPLFCAGAAESPRTMDEFIKQPVHFLRQTLYGE